jgi:hypothetical protein
MPMRLLRQYRFFLLFLGLLVFSSLMVIRQYDVNRSRHVELREAFILLQARGYTNQAERLFQRLLRELPEQPDKVLVDDFQRTMMLVDPTSKRNQNLVWTYHWTVSNELERRSEGTIHRALKLAHEI